MMCAIGRCVGAVAWHQVGDSRALASVALQAKVLAPGRGYWSLRLS